MTTTTLDYAVAKTATTDARRTPGHLTRLLLALPALVVPFVSFTFSTSPLEAVSDRPGWMRSGDWMIFLLGAGFFGGIPLVAWRLRQICWSATPRRWERIALSALVLPGIAPACGVAALLLLELSKQLTAATQPADVDAESIACAAAVIVPLVIGIALAVRRGACGRRVLATESLLLTGYVANAAVCLLGFRLYPELGYWLTIPPAMAFTFDLLRPPRGSN